MMFDIAVSFDLSALDASATLPLIRTDRGPSIASKTLETTPLDTCIALRWTAMRESNNLRPGAVN
jgi:hypothetical protein